jgi:hypothetical protein
MRLLSPGDEGSDGIEISLLRNAPSCEGECQLDSPEEDEQEEQDDEDEQEEQDDEDEHEPFLDCDAGHSMAG